MNSKSSQLIAKTPAQPRSGGADWPASWRTLSHGLGTGRYTDPDFARLEFDKQPRLAGGRPGGRDSGTGGFHHLQDRRSAHFAGARRRGQDQGLLQFLPPPGHHPRRGLRPLRQGPDRLPLPRLALGSGRQQPARAGTPGVQGRATGRPGCGPAGSKLRGFRRFRLYQPGPEPGAVRRVYRAGAPIPGGPSPTCATTCGKRPRCRPIGR